MYSARDKVGLLAAITAAAALVWFGMSHYGSGSATGYQPSGPAATTSSKQTVAAVQRYLRTLQRIDAPVEAKERRTGTIMRASLNSPTAMSPAVTNRIRAVGEAYIRASARVSTITAAPGFERAQHLLASVYRDQGRSYLAILQWESDGSHPQNDPMWMEKDLDRINDALGSVDTDIRNCRAAFAQATNAAGVADPPWVAALINHATGQPSG